MFNNGYNNFYPYQGTPARASLFSSLKGKFNWSSLLSNTQKTLNIINQAIPVFYQIRPIWNNAKTVFKIMGAMKEDDQKKSTYKSTSTNTNTNQNTNSKHKTITSTSNSIYNDNTPNFFL